MTFAFFLVYLVLTYIHPGQIVPALAPYRITYWVGMAGLVVAIASLFGKRAGLAASLQLWVLLIFTALTTLSLMIAERWMGAPLLILQRFGPSLTIFVLAMCSVTSLMRLRITAGCVIVLTTTLMLQGAAAYHFGYNARMFLFDRSTIGEPDDDGTVVSADGRDDRGDRADRGDRDDQDEFDAIDYTPDDATDNDAPREMPRIRALGFMHDPNDLAVGMVVALGLIAGAWRPSRQLPHVLLAAAAGALVYGIYLTRSRGGALALVIVAWRFAARRVGPVPALVVLLALGAAVVAQDFGGRALSTELDESASERIVAWTEGFEMLKMQPVLGVGYGRFGDFHTLTAHNSLVLCFAETGLVGCFFWVGLVVITMLELQGLKLRPGSGHDTFDSTAKHYAEGLQLALIGFLTAAFFLSRTFVPTLYLIVGLSAALAAMARDEGTAVPLPALSELAMIVLACELGGIGVVYTMVKLHVA